MLTPHPILYTTRMAGRKVNLSGARVKGTLGSRPRETAAASRVRAPSPAANMAAAQLRGMQKAKGNRTASPVLPSMNSRASKVQRIKDRMNKIQKGRMR